MEKVTSNDSERLIVDGIWPEATEAETVLMECGRQQQSLLVSHPPDIIEFFTRDKENTRRLHT